jgi:hypothetical protein
MATSVGCCSGEELCISACCVVSLSFSAVCLHIGRSWLPVMNTFGIISRIRKKRAVRYFDTFRYSVYLFILRLFNGTSSHWAIDIYGQTIAWCITNELERCGSYRSWPALRHSHGILKKTDENYEKYQSEYLFGKLASFQSEVPKRKAIPASQKGLLITWVQPGRSTQYAV